MKTSSLLALSLVWAASFACSSRADTNCVPPPAGLIGWWPGDGNANDIYGGNNGTLQNGAAFALGETGLGFDFETPKASLQIPYSSALLPSTYSIEAWIKPLAQPPMGEWPLHKAEPAQPGHGVANIAFGTVAVLVARYVKARVFVFLALNGAGFSSARAFGHQIGGQRCEQFGPQLSAFLFSAGLAHRVGELAQSIEGALKADRSEER